MSRWTTRNRCGLSALASNLPDCHPRAYSRVDGTFRIEPARGDFVLPKSGALEVEVESVDWMTAEYLTIEVTWPDQTGFAYERAYFQLDAQPYRIDILAPGRYFARLSVGDLSIQQEVEILEGKTAKATFRLR